MKIYRGDNESVKVIEQKFLDSALSALERSTPDARDGLKPVHRRSLRTMHDSMKVKPGAVVKSQTVVGRVMGEEHPHGDSAIYSAMVRMTDKFGLLQVPLFSGRGNLSVYHSSAPAGAARYTELSLDKGSEVFYAYGSQHVPMIKNDLGYQTPIFLATMLPMLLVNQTSGIAVGFSNNHWGYPLKEVTALCREYMSTGSIDPSHYMIPDFPGGNEIVEDRVEASRVMLTGHGRFEVRSRFEIQGKRIFVKSIPSDKTVEAMISDIEQIQSDVDARGRPKMPGLQHVDQVINSVGAGSDTFITIVCDRTVNVEKTVVELIRRNVLRKFISLNNLMMVPDGMEGASFTEETVSIPLTRGAHQYIQMWVDFRRNFVRTSAMRDIQSFDEEQSRLRDFLLLINSPEDKEEYLRLLTTVSAESAMDFLRGTFYPAQGVSPSEDTLSWIADRSAKVFLEGGVYRKRFEDNKALISKLEGISQNPDSVILEEFEFCEKHFGNAPRRSSLTSKRYKFVTRKEDNATPKDTNLYYFTIYRNGFVKKTSRKIFDEGFSNEEVLNVVRMPGSGTLLGFDNLARVIRMYGDDIPITRNKMAGEYLFKYIGDTELDNAEVILKTTHLTYMGILDGQKLTLLFSNGKVSVVDTSKYITKKAYRTISNALNSDVFDSLVDVFTEDQVSDVLMAWDDSRLDVPRSGFWRVGLSRVSDWAIPAGNKGATPVFRNTNSTPGVHITHYAWLTSEQADNLFRENYPQEFTDLKGIKPSVLKQTPDKFEGKFSPFPFSPENEEMFERAFNLPAQEEDAPSTLGYLTPQEGRFSSVVMSEEELKEILSQ